MAAVKNHSYSVVAVAPSPATSGVMLTVSAGHGSRFVVGRPVSIYPSGTPSLPENTEIGLVENIVGDVLTIQRVYEDDHGVGARAIVVGDQIAQTLTAGEWNALEATVAAKAASSHSHSDATTGSAGFMSASDKTKLDGVAPGATAYGNSSVLAYLLSLVADGQYFKRNGNTIDGGTPSGAGGDVAGDTHAATSKTTPVDADELPLVDSAASWGLKKLTWANLKATLKTYLDTIYSAAGHNHSGVYDPAGTASSAMSSHTGAPDPHSQYALESALGTAATHNVPATGNAASGEVVKGSDTRLSDSRPPTAHAASHTNGTDDIQDATAAQKGLATAAQITKLDGIEAAADVTDAGNVGAAIHGATAKTTPVDADTVPVIDSAASNVLKKSTWANVKATLKTYFDSIYQAAGSYAASSHTHAQSDITNLVTDLGNKQAASSALSSAQAQGTASIRAIGTTTPADIGTATAGSSTEAAAKDHVHAIPNGHVSNAKLADMAASTIKARKTASTGAPEDCTVLEVQTLLNPLSINTQTASYTLVLSDAAKLVRMNVSSACVLYVPKESSDTSPVNFPIGTTILIEQSHASGQITVSAVTAGSGSAATINCEGGANKSKAQFAQMTLTKTASNTWTLEGNRTT